MCKAIGGDKVDIAIVHGSRDASIDYPKSNDLFERIDCLKVNHKLISIEGGSHAIAEEVSTHMEKWIKDGLK